MQNPLIPMVAMTGAPSKKEVFDFIKNMKEKCGFEQLMLYPRSGCEVVYLSKAWFELCSYYIEGASVCGMKIWLYDEFNWPAGQAGWRVTVHNEYRLKNLLVKTDGKTVNFEVILTDYPDILNEDAMNLFVSLTHEEYKKHFGSYFGSTVVGMYTDEPSFGYGTGKDRLPYYEDVENDYRKAFGTEFFKDIEQSVTGESANSDKSVYARLYQLCAQKMYHCFSEKIGSWCKENGLLLTGHLMDDETPSGNTLHSGDAFLNLSAFGKPGIDEIGTCTMNGTNTLDWLLPFADAFSANSTHGAMAELFAFGPYDMSHTKEVQMLALTALHGIDTWFLAVGHFDMRGNLTKKRYFRNYTHANPDHDAYWELAEKAKQFAVLARKKRVSYVGILYDRDRIAESIPTERLQAENRAYMMLTRALHKTQTDFKIVQPGEVWDKEILFLPEKDGTVRNIRTGELFADAKSAASYAARKTPDLVRALTEDGNVANDVFLRHFADGSYCLVDVAQKSVNRILYVDGKKVFLPACGVYDSEEMPLEFLCKASVEHEKVIQPGKNVFRFLFPSGLHEKEFFCEEDTDVVFTVRDIHAEHFFTTDGNARAEKRGELVRGNAVGQPHLYLDGTELDTFAKDELLPDGFSEFYHQTPILHLCAGKHTVCVENALYDVKFLPLLLVFGAFEVDYEHSSLLKVKTPYSGESIGFWGECQYTATIHIPEIPADKELYFSVGCPLYKKLYINGTKMGEGGLCDLGLWRIPPECAGQMVEITVLYESTLAPLFGDTAIFVRDNTVDSGFWADIARPYPTYPIGVGLDFYAKAKGGTNA